MLLSHYNLLLPFCVHLHNQFHRRYYRDSMDILMFFVVSSLSKSENSDFVSQPASPVHSEQWIIMPCTSREMLKDSVVSSSDMELKN